MSLRLFWAMVLVILAGAGTLLTVSLLLAPAIFTRHLEAAGEIADTEVIARCTRALAACRPGDTVTIAVHDTPTPEVTVTDTGHGFNPDQASWAKRWDWVVTVASDVESAGITPSVIASMVASRAAQGVRSPWARSAPSTTWP